MSTYLVSYTYGPDTEKRMGIRPQHRDWLSGLFDRGTVLVAGPTGAAEAPGGRLLFRADSREEVAALLTDDPYYGAGVVAETSVVEWEIVFGPWQD